MTDIISRDAAASILEPHGPLFADCLRTGWKRWLEEPPEKRLVARKRTRACIVSDYAHERAAEVFETVEAVTPRESRGLTLYDVEGRLLVRFKKLRKSLKPSNIRTVQQTLWAEQEPLPGMPEVTGIVAGYVLNELETEIDRVVFVCLVNDNPRWHFDIDSPAEGGGGTVVPMPAPKGPPSDQLVRSKRPKPGTGKGGEQGSPTSSGS